MKNLMVGDHVRKLIVLTYRTTARFPRSEMYGLVSQMRRAAISIGSNIAEGCGKSTDAGFRQSLDQAMGEASELEFQCLVASDLEFGLPEEVSELTQETERAKRMLARFIIALRKRNSTNRRGNANP